MQPVPPPTPEEQKAADARRDALARQARLLNRRDGQAALARAARANP